MSDKTPYNEPAFPVRDYSGMSMRDYFAAKALQGLLADPVPVQECNRCSQYAVVAYRYADAMLAAREGGKP